MNGFFLGLAVAGWYSARVDQLRRQQSYGVRFCPYIPKISQKKRRRLERGRR